MAKTRSMAIAGRHEKFQQNDNGDSSEENRKTIQTFTRNFSFMICYGNTGVIGAYSRSQSLSKIDLIFEQIIKGTILRAHNN